MHSASLVHNALLEHNRIAGAKPAHPQAQSLLPLGLQAKHSYVFLTQCARSAVILCHQMALLLSAGRNSLCHSAAGTHSVLVIALVRTVGVQAGANVLQL